MRLIDADKMFKLPNHQEFSTGYTDGYDDAISNIESQPTAYDLAAVIAELEEYMEEYSQVDENGMHNAKWCAMGEALDVVKRGGRK